MISPETSGEIFTSTSGWILPVAVTSCVMARLDAFSVVTGIGCSRFFRATAAPIVAASATTMMMKMISFFRERLGGRYIGLVTSVIGFDSLVFWKNGFAGRKLQPDGER